MPSSPGQQSLDLISLADAVFGDTARVAVPQHSSERLIDAAIEIASQFGTSAVTPGRVAGRAGLSRTAARHHFPDRDALLNGVGERLASIDPISPAPAYGGPDSLARMLHEYRRYVAENPSDLRARIQLRAVAASGHRQIATALAAQQRRVTRSVATRMSDITASKTTRWLQPAALLTSSWLAIELSHMMDADATAREQAYQALSECLTAQHPALAGRPH